MFRVQIAALGRREGGAGAARRRQEAPRCGEWRGRAERDAVRGGVGLTCDSDVGSIGVGVDVTPPLLPLGEAGTAGGACPRSQSDSGGAGTARGWRKGGAGAARGRRGGGARAAQGQREGRREGGPHRR